MNDIFRPKREPEATIYDAFQEEAAKRGKRTVDEWLSKEREIVWKTARDYAQKNGMRAPSWDEVLLSERSASGHIDYGSKWAYGVAEFMRIGPK